MVKAEYIIAAYEDCRKGKASSPDAIRFETYLFENITDLVEKINSRTYEPMPSITFVVSRPVYREVFAANFRDRVIHHYIALRLEPLFEGVFSDRTYNCRCGKGQLYGVRQLAADIKECSENFTKPCWYLKCDMKGFFMSIPREELADKVDAFILDNYKGDDIEDLRYLSRVTIMNDPTKNCIKRSSEETMAKVPLGKTLRGAKKNHGLPIGNLTSQHDANFWLNDFDWMLEIILHIYYHVRYVDDMVLVARRKETLLRLMPMIRETLASLGLRLNEKKFYFQHYSKGVRFVGAIIKRDRIYSVNNTINNFRRSVRKLNDAARNGDIEAINHAIQSVNSYLGIFGYYNEYGMKRQIIKDELDEEAWKFFVIKGHYRSVQLKKRYNIDMKYKNMANEILNHKTEERKDIPTENEISKMLDEGYELEMYIIDGRIHVECYPRDS